MYGVVINALYYLIREGIKKNEGVLFQDIGREHEPRRTSECECPRQRAKETNDSIIGFCFSPV